MRNVEQHVQLLILMLPTLVVVAAAALSAL
jgi:hypothetical protein